MSVDQAYNYCNIDAQTCTAGLLSPEQLAGLSPEGYRTVINLLPEDNEYAVAGERDLVTGQGIAYLYVPVDFANPTAADYTDFEQAMAAREGRTMIHCAANFRVSAFYAIYAHRHLDWSPARAWEHIESIWQPAEYPPWETFITQFVPRPG